MISNNVNELYEKYLNNLKALQASYRSPQELEYYLKRPVNLSYDGGGPSNIDMTTGYVPTSEESALRAGYGTVVAKNPPSNIQKAVAGILGFIPGIGPVLSNLVDPTRIGGFLGQFGIVGPGMTVQSEFGTVPASVGAMMAGYGVPGNPFGEFGMTSAQSAQSAGYGVPGDPFGEFGPSMSSYNEAATNAASGMTSAQSAESAGFGSDSTGEGGGTSDSGGDASGDSGSFAEGGIVNLLNYYYGKR